jgi:DNA-directed RNA polymerase subunit F
MCEFEVDRRSRDKVDVLLATLLSRGETVEQAARFVGISVRTAYRRMASVEFKELLLEFDQMLSAACFGRVVDALPEATESLRRMMREENPNLQFKAASKLLDVAMAMRDVLARERRGERLEIPAGKTLELPSPPVESGGTGQLSEGVASPVREG